jgi:hypothetical protein
MESYNAESDPPVDVCLRDVRACDVYVGVFAWRYGHVPDGETQSITELEYQAAAEAGKHCLIFLLDPSAPWPADQVDYNRSSIEDLRAKLTRDRTVSYFSSADDLGQRLATSLHQVVSADVGSESATTNDSASAVLPSDLAQHTRSETHRNKGLNPFLAQLAADTIRRITSITPRRVRPQAALLSLVVLLAALLVSSSKTRADNGNCNAVGDNNTITCGLQGESGSPDRTEDPGAARENYVNIPAAHGGPACEQGIRHKTERSRVSLRVRAYNDGNITGAPQVRIGLHEATQGSVVGPAIFVSSWFPIREGKEVVLIDEMAPVDFRICAEFRGRGPENFTGWIRGDLYY